MRVGLRGFAVRRPARMSDAGAADQRLPLSSLRQHLHFADATQSRHVALTINDGQTGRIITAILQATQAFQQNLCDIALRYCTYNSTHKCYS